MQSRRFASFFNTLDGFPYQDKGSTGGEPDTRAGDPEKENPGALAGATGADVEKQSLQSEDYRMRAECATALAEAIANCHPDDAVQLMAAALHDLTPEGPRCDVFLSVAEDAAWWASVAAPPQLAAVLSATLDQLGNRAMHLDTRKRLFLALWRSFRSVDQRAFLDYVRRVA